MGRLRQFRPAARRSSLLALDLGQLGLRPLRHCAGDGGRAALGVAFRFILAPEAGFMAYVNHALPGFWNPALNGGQAMIAIVIAYTWKYIGYNFVFFLAALQAIPK